MKRTAIDLLKELHALVWGECRSLLDEDSGGSADLDIAIREALAAEPPSDDEIEKTMLKWAKDEGPFHDYERNDLIAGVREVLSLVSS